MSALLHDLLLRLDQWHDTLQQLGWIGVLGYSVGLVVLQMVFIPLSVFGIAAGAIFGFWRGVLVITIGTNLGSAVNFLISRYVARKAVSRYLSHHEKFRLIDAAIGREGGKIVALLRLCPMPFGLCNYAYGLTAIRFWPYFIATFLTIIPANCFVVWIGASAHDLAAAASAEQSHQTGKYILLGVGFIAGVCALNYIARIAKAAVAKGAPAADEAPVA